MASIGIFSTHIQKLGHPIKEIRERGLLQLLTKLKCGFTFDDEVARKRELLDQLLEWFNHDKASLQKEALQLLESIIKSESGSQIMRELDQNDFFSRLDSIKDKIDEDAEMYYHNVLDLLQFVSNIRSDTDLRLPILRCNSNSSLNTYEPESARRTESLDSARSKSSEESREQHSDKITSVPQKPSQLPKHILVYLLPWARFNESDMKTFTLMEDTLQVVKSTSRCCRFILHVFIRDFPAEVFLNHPSVVQKLENLLDSVKCGEVLEVLLGITKSIERRLDQLFDPAFKNSSIKFRDSQKGDSHATEMQPATISVRCMFGSCDKALDQLPVPFFCLNCASKVLSNLAQFNPNDANIAFDLLDCLLTLLRKCVSAEMWNVRHESKTYRDIAQGTYALLKSSGDLLEQLKKCNEKSSKNTHSRLNWIRAVRFTSRLLTWRSGVLDSDGGCSPRPGTGVGPLPPSLVDALEAVLTDVALSAAYPRIVGTIINVVEKPPLALDPQFMRKYREMTRLCESIDHATYLLNKPNENDPKIFSIINRSLSAFEMHQSSNFIENVVRLLFVKTSKFDLTDDRWCDVRKICLFLMANDKDWVRQTIYKMAADIVMAVTTSSGNGNYNENHLNLLFDAQILTEICCHGVVSPCKVISVCSKEILLYLLRSKLVLTESSWRRFIASIIPILSLLDCHAKRDDVLGDAILRIMDMKIAECMQIPRLEILRSNTRVLFNKCYSAQMEAAHNLCRLLCMQDDSDAYLPTPDCIRADMLISALRGTEASDFNIDSNPMLSETDQLLGLTQILDAISQDLTYQRNEPLLEGSVNKESKIDPAFRRSILQQLSVMMRQQGLHSVFLENDGLRIVSIYLRLSLTADDYSLYPDCAICCLSILNSLCGRNAHTRHTLARNQIMYFLIIRAILVHPSDTRTTHLGGQLLFIISQADCAVWDGDEVSLPHAVCTRIRAPLKLTSYWEISVNAVRLCYEWVIEEQNWRSFVRMHWTCSLHNGADNVVKWPCVPPVSMDYAPFLAITEEELVKLKVTAILEGSQQALYKIQNSTSHKAAENAIALLISYTSLLEDAIIPKEQFYSLPWMETFSTYLTSLPSSPKDVNLLLVVIRFLEAFLDSVTSDYSDTAKGWLIKTLIDSSDSVFGIVEKTHVYSITGGGDTQFDVKCRATVARLMSRLPANASIGKLTRSLHDLDYGQFNTLVFLNELVRSVRCILCSSCDITRDNLVAITESLIACTQSSPQVNSSYRGYKGEALLLDVFVCIGAIAHRMDEMDQPIEKCELQWNALVRSLVCGSSCVLVGARSAALSVLARLAASKQTLYQIEEGFETEGYQCDRFVMKKLLDEREASLVKEQAAKMITVLAGHKYEVKTLILVQLSRLTLTYKMYENE